MEVPEKKFLFLRFTVDLHSTTVTPTLVAKLWQSRSKSHTMPYKQLLDLYTVYSLYYAYYLYLMMSFNLINYFKCWDGDQCVYCRLCLNKNRFKTSYICYSCPWPSTFPAWNLLLDSDNTILYISFFNHHMN